ncbi:uncharacterized protein LACBIDRAFT_327152 [Laccaria bicolor S238N-H82]|uniref:Predicted protein n=1 Tax=Laccaria bicolor (strain S238N-H82 / ATCC MYA-4686) TaxID=486041 RepID=B0DBB5_LACBS|nr:uncharacterized protein LACBIDRAFT_327152 [Laccaria bicolor S238N-H82]EDR08162.1 predicted protein [Laccaria bicolor S238N-H82]|eukprot:XP_001881232.1 predicted protein [Laccaria bicolor S238N-H82]
MVDVPSPVTSGSLACKSPTSTYDVYGLPANVYIPSLDYFTPHVANMSLTACRHVTSTTSQRRGHMGESIMIAGKGAIGGITTHKDDSQDGQLGMGWTRHVYSS